MTCVLIQHVSNAHKSTVARHLTHRGSLQQLVSAVSRRAPLRRFESGGVARTAFIRDLCYLRCSKAKCKLYLSFRTQYCTRRVLQIQISSLRARNCVSHRTANDDQVQLEERATDGYATKQSANCDCKSVQSTGQLGQSLEACPHRETRALEPARCLAVHVGRRGLVSRTSTAARSSFALFSVPSHHGLTGR